jgi:hypothetical protein
MASVRFAYPAVYLLLSTYMLSASFVTLLVGLSGLLGWVLGVNTSSKSQPELPTIPKMPPESPQDYAPTHSRGIAPAQRLLRSAILAAITTSDSIPEPSLRTDHSLKKELRRHRGRSGFLMTGCLKPPDIDRLKTVLEASQCHLLTKDDHFELVINPGCSKVVSPCIGNFKKGSLKDLPIPLAMEGIAGQLIAKQKGTIRYEVINDAGRISVLKCEGYYLPALKIRLFSPQTFLSVQGGGRYSLEWNKSFFELKNGDTITVGYHHHHQTALPVL